MTTALTYEIHPLAHLMPEMREAEYVELREDVAANGLREAITLYEGQILDGRHRYRACEETGVWPAFTTYTGDEPAGYVLSLNVKRRQLTQSQKAMLATDFLPHLEDEAKRRQGSRTDLHPTSSSLELEVVFSRARQRAAERVGVSHAQVGRAKYVKENDAELADRVRQGDVTVTSAYEETRKANGAVASVPTKDGTRKHSASALVDNFIGMVENLPTALQQIDVQAAVLAEDAPLADWDRRLTTAIVALGQLRKQIRGANA